MDSERELLGTVASCVVVLVAVFVVRVCINRIIWFLACRRDLKRGDEPRTFEPTIPFLSWEVQVMLIMFQGLAESAGEVRTRILCSQCFVCPV